MPAGAHMLSITGTGQEHKSLLRHVAQKFVYDAENPCSKHVTNPVARPQRLQVPVWKKMHVHQDPEHFRSNRIATVTTL